jgi:uncharacterized membrane protein (DUF485 family)
MKALLLALLLLPLSVYFLLIAWAPQLLALPCGFVPLSIPLALGLIWLGFLITCIYVYQTNRQAEADA